MAKASKGKEKSTGWTPLRSNKKLKSYHIDFNHDFAYHSWIHALLCLSFSHRATNSLIKPNTFLCYEKHRVMSEYENYVKKGTSNFNEKEDLPRDIYPITTGLPLVHVI